MALKLLVHNLNYLNRLSEIIADNSFGGMFLGLIGDLGTGKTQFTKFFVENLGGNIDEVVSPTFTIMNEYKTEKFKVYHFDLYRLDNIEELEEIGYKDFFYDNNAVTIVEWIDKVSECKPENFLILKFSFLNDENSRDIEIEFSGEKYKKLISHINSKFHCEG